MESGSVFVGYGLAADHSEPGDRWEQEAEEGFMAVIDSIDFDTQE